MDTCSRKRGTCCAGVLCKHAEMQLVPREHHCMGCGGVYHVLCAKFIPQPLDNDPYNGSFLCLKCETIPPTTNNDTEVGVRSACHVVPSPAIVVPCTSPPDVSTATIICKACKKEGHYNSNSKKCSLFKGRKRKKY